MSKYHMLFTEKEIKEKVEDLSKEIAFSIFTKDLVIVPIMTGAMFFCVDLCRELSKYSKTFIIESITYKSRGDVKVEVIDNLLKYENKDLLLVDDIFDTGHSLIHLINKLNRTNKFNHIYSCVLLNKHEVNESLGWAPDFIGFKVPNKFVCGYGMDIDGYYRNLKSIGYYE